MNREQLEHVLRAASQIADDPDVVVIGSQSVLGAIPEDRLPRDTLELDPRVTRRLERWIGMYTSAD
ncbi:hypothetical protein ACFQFC_24770 [Amorphoplanes digitatis]|uniref:Uncharacterized protein n=1 Tax=Actinoplanes digitatis TaxID=1868 RepID=A0A7W7MV92_9ACTN|nr:hypothetical protein [Actinoplanes digitatis]MBB4767434.1 hypothetical protein [Actinoplanes digitatis]BFE67143.1 hypothetical protein GCM10020092_004440 [Actinoplanes digitatis]GID97859.1 hypothetical protein Adi01nite_72710 [Actinoplanes digitatis]